MAVNKDDLNSSRNRVWAEISHSALLHNLSLIREKTATQAQLACVVKADAYGHSARLVAPVLENEGKVRFFCVATLPEAVELRNLGIKSDILIMSSPDPSFVTEMKDYNLITTIADTRMIRYYEEQAAKTAGVLRVHLKLDTGMARLGLSTDEKSISDTVQTALRIARSSQLKLEGVFSHLSSGLADPAYSVMQLLHFKDFLRRFESYDQRKLIRHIAASSSLAAADFAFDMVRAGVSLYGGRIEPEAGWENLRPVMSVFSHVVQIRDCPRGSYVSYGQSWQAPRDTRLAIIDAGYADGIMRLLSNRGSWLINGHEAKIRGRICMDRCLADITDFPDIEVGDRAMFFGEYNSERLSAAYQAEKAETIDYELFCNISARVPRFLV